MTYWPIQIGRTTKLPTTLFVKRIFQALIENFVVAASRHNDWASVPSMRKQPSEPHSGLAEGLKNSIRERIPRRFRSRAIG